MTVMKLGCWRSRITLRLLVTRIFHEIGKHAVDTATNIIIIIKSQLYNKQKQLPRNSFISSGGIPILNSPIRS